MKKFFVCLLIVALFAGFVFYLGWVQIKVKPDNVGIIISKTQGINEEPVVPGEFRWTNQFLLPTNAELIQFKIQPIFCEKVISGQLPSGDLYTSIYNSGNNFSYKLTYKMSLTVSPQSLVDLFSQNKIVTQEDFEKYLNGAADTIAQLATNYILEKLRENKNFRPESIRRDDMFRSLKIYNDFPEIELSEFAIVESIVPDFTLYSQLQNQFIQNQDKYFINTEKNSSSKNDSLSTDYSDDYETFTEVEE